jgi:sigma-E factor negative regulatory protein RseB
MRFYSKISIIALLSLVSANSLADDLFDMLKQMSEAGQNQNYHGTFILRKSDDLSSLRVTHGVDEQGVWERMDSLNGESKQVLRHNNRVFSVYPDRQLVTVRHTTDQQSLHPQLPENIDQLKLFYSMTRLADDRIANHPTLVVDLLPKDEYRYGYRYWIDKNTGMLLRCDLLTGSDEVAEQMMFTSLEYVEGASSHGIDLQQFERFNQQVIGESSSDSTENSKTVWEVRQLPQGFMLMQNTMRYSKPSGLLLSKNDNGEANPPPDLQHLVYSDGLASVSVFIEKNKGNGSHLQGASSMGSVNAFGHALGKYVITVVGAVPEKTVQLIAQTAVQIP